MNAEKPLTSTTQVKYLRRSRHCSALYEPIDPANVRMGIGAVQGKLRFAWEGDCLRLALSLSVVLCLAAPKVLAQEGGSPPGSSSESAVAASLDVQADAQPQEAMPWGDSAQTNTKPEGENRVQPGPNLQQNPPLPGQQPKRILGLMPNFRAVSAGARSCGLSDKTEAL